MDGWTGWMDGLDGWMNGWIDTPQTMTTRAPAVLKNNNTYKNANLDHL